MSEIFILLHDPLSGAPFRVDVEDIAAIHPATLEQRPARARIDRLSQPVTYFVREEYLEVLDFIGIEATHIEREYFEKEQAPTIEIPSRQFVQSAKLTY